MSLPRNIVRALRHTSRRAYSTGSSSSPASSWLPLGGSLALAAYATWHIAAERNRIALDARVSSSDAGLPPSPDTLPGPPRRVGMPPPPSEDAPPGPGAGLPPPPDTLERVGEPLEDANAESDDGEAQSAFDPKTGEINWDCPCLGGMAHGPCGMAFREAFSCFVFSEAEPKGMDCIDKFKAMQDCFRDHPEVYAEELRDDDDEEADAQESATSPDMASPGSQTEATSKPPEQERM